LFWLVGGKVLFEKCDKNCQKPATINCIVMLITSTFVKTLKIFDFQFNFSDLLLTNVAFNRSPLGN
jgi:hypothetical protein